MTSESLARQALASALLLMTTLTCGQSGEPTTAPADGDALALALESSATEIEIGQTATLVLTLSAGAATPEEGITLPKLAFDERSIALDITFEGREWHYSRIAGMVERPPPLETGKLTAAEPWKLEVPLVLPQAGEYEIKAVHGHRTKARAESESLKIVVKPVDAGDRLLARFDMKHGENDGSYTVELYPDVAMGTVLNFTELASTGYFDATRMHRVVKGFMSQGGDPNTRDADPANDGIGGPGYSLPGEFDPKKFPNVSHELGVLSMARRGHPDSAGSQFFVCSSNARFLDDKYTAFGKVIEGIDVAEACNQIATRPSPGNPREVSQPVSPLNLIRVALVPGFSARPADGGQDR